MGNWQEAGRDGEGLSGAGQGADTGRDVGGKASCMAVLSPSRALEEVTPILSSGNHAGQNRAGSPEVRGLGRTVCAGVCGHSADCSLPLQ